MNRQLLGASMVLAAAALWGSTGTAQTLVAGHMSPYWVGALRLLVASAFFFVLDFAGGRPKHTAAAMDSSSQLLALASGVAIAIYNLSFFAGVQLSGVGVGTAIAIGSGPIWAGLLQATLTKVAPRLDWWLGTLIAVAGGFMLTAGDPAGPRGLLNGLWLCLLAGLAYSSYALISQRLVRRCAPSVALRWVFVVAATIAIPLAVLLDGAFSPTLASWMVVVYLGVVATGVSYLLFAHALQHISGATGVTLALAEPVTAFVLAVLLLDYKPAGLGYLGIAFVLAGLLVVARAELRGGARAASARSASTSSL